MPLSTEVVRLIRNEIGDDTDFYDNISDGTPNLETIYTNEGQENILVTSLIVWRKRLANMNARSFDVTKEGAWLARNQRARFLMQMVNKYERLVKDKPRSSVHKIKSGTALIADDAEYYDL